MIEIVAIIERWTTDRPNLLNNNNNQFHDLKEEKCVY